MVGTVACMHGRIVEGNHVVAVAAVVVARASLGAARAVIARARRLLLLLWRHALKHALRQRVHPALVAAQGRVWRATR